MSGPTSGGAPNASECKLFLNWFVGPLGALSDALYLVHAMHVGASLKLHRAHLSFDMVSGEAPDALGAIVDCSTCIFNSFYLVLLSNFS
jgi:hypothetical protein